MRERMSLHHRTGIAEFGRAHRHGAAGLVPGPALRMSPLQTRQRRLASKVRITVRRLECCDSRLSRTDASGRCRGRRARRDGDGRSLVANTERYN